MYISPMLQVSQCATIWLALPLSGIFLHLFFRHTYHSAHACRIRCRSAHLFYLISLRIAWVANANSISLEYTGTGALKTEFTRTGNWSMGGALSDGISSAKRYLCTRTQARPYIHAHNTRAKKLKTVHTRNWIMAPRSATVSAAQRGYEGKYTHANAPTHHTPCKHTSTRAPRRCSEV